jgi:hypothetical protein
MNSSPAHERRSHFHQHYLMWIVVRHFLPADLTEELSKAIVEAVSDGKLSFDSLFESETFGTSTITKSWVVRPRQNSARLGDYLQRYIRGLVWQGDEPSFVITQGVEPTEVKAMQDLEAASWASQIDFERVNELPLMFPNAPESIQKFIEAVSSLQALNSIKSSAEIDDTIGIFLALPKPLDAILVKHLGDLSVDADNWTLASILYERADYVLSEFSDPSWTELVTIMRTIILQSKAAALRTIDGSLEASKFLSGLLAGTDLSTGFSTVVNASLDTLVAATLSNDNHKFIDNRPAILIAPQLLKTHDLSNAFESSLNHKYEQAHRWFWAVLRRQIALGGASDTRRTKAWYGRSLVEASSVTEVQSQPGNNFALGVRLLVEGADPHVAKQTSWTTEIVAVNVNAAFIEGVIAHAKRNQGSSIERAIVTVTIFQEWLKLLPPNSDEIATHMIEYFAESAINFEWSLFGNENVFSPSFDALKEVRKSRPEFSHLAITSIVRAIVNTLATQHVNAVSIALNTADDYFDALDDSALHLIVRATLDTLDKFGSDTGPWTVVRPALSLLSSAQAILSRTDPALEKLVASSLIRFSIANEFENPNLLYLLRDTDPAYIEKAVDISRLNEVVENIRAQARQINSSATVSNILALLEAPAIVKQAGVNDAINSTLLILKSAADAKPTISFSSAYQTLLLLPRRSEAIAQALGLSEVEFAKMLEPLISPLLQLWMTAAEKPHIFAGFSIPQRTVPNPTLVHNWTFASIGLARMLNQEQALAVAMESAGRNPLLETSIMVARAIRTGAGDPVEFDLDAIKKEKREAFYPALGQRLVSLYSLPSDTRNAIITCLLQQCFYLGPNALDAGVFVAALESGIEPEPSSGTALSYRGRLNNDRALRLSLFPFVEKLRPLVGH